MISHFFSFFFSPFSFFPAVFQNSQTYQMPHGGSLALWSWLGSQWNHSSESKRQKRVHIKRVKLRRTLQGLHRETSACPTSFLWKSFSFLVVLVVHAQSCPTLCDSMDCSLPGSSVHGFSRQEYWSGLPCPPPEDLPDPGSEPVSPALAGRFFTTVPPEKGQSLPQVPNSKFNQKSDNIQKKKRKIVKQDKTPLVSPQGYR